METKPLGRSGLRVSVVGLGCNNFGMRCDQAQTRAVVAKALDLGVTLFDTADVYGPRGVSEEYLGKALESRRARRSCSPPSSPCRWATARSSAAARGAGS